MHYTPRNGCRAFVPELPLRVPFYSFKFGESFHRWVYIEADSEAEAWAMLQTAYEGTGYYVFPFRSTEGGSETEYINIYCHPDDVWLEEVWESDSECEPGQPGSV